MINGRRTAFFDPWIDLDYYYSLLPLLPLLFDRIFVYYPSDRWALSTPRLAPLDRGVYIDNLLYWVNEGVLVPVVKGDYPFSSDIGPSRQQHDEPSGSFRDALGKRRKTSESDWVILSRDATDRGRESARKIITDGGSSAVANALRVKVDRAAVPELAYHYAGGDKATIAQTLIETIGTYENDDWIRRDRHLGEYLLPAIPAYQYRALRDMRANLDRRVIFHQAALTALHEHAKRRMRMGPEWPSREHVRLWRHLGLHEVLREFLVAEAEARQSTGDEEGAVAVGLTKRLADLRGSIPVKLAALLLDSNVLWTVLAAVGGLVAGLVTSNIFVGLLGGTVVGSVGVCGVRWALTRASWIRLIDRIEIELGSSPVHSLRKFALGFGDVTVFSSGNG